MPVNKQPQAISEKTWEDIKAACISGMGFSAAARAFGINNVHTIIMKCRRNRWPIPARIQERAKALQEGRYKAHKLARERNCNGDQALEVLAEDWISRGEAHRALVFDLTNTALRRLGNQPPDIANWPDFERADKAGRRACGLDDSETARNINVGMQMIEFRLSKIHLPPDALEATKELPEDASALPTAKPLQTPDSNKPQEGGL